MDVIEQFKIQVLKHKVSVCKIREAGIEFYHACCPLVEDYVVEVREPELAKLKKMLKLRIKQSLEYIASLAPGQAPSGILDHLQKSNGVYKP